jgi:outer membrane protein assembly factor BamB
MSKRIASFGTMLALVAAFPATATDWPQFGRDSRHSGSNPTEHVITRDNVAQLAVFYWVEFPSHISAAPVYLNGVQTPLGRRNLAFLLGDNGSLYAMNVLDGTIVWSHEQPPGDFFNRTESSPAIDPNRSFVYAYQLDGKVHKFAVGDGAEIATDGWPQVVTLKPQWEHVASALAVATSANGGSYLYAVTDGYYGDVGDYQGHLTTIDLATGAQKVFNTLCSGLAIHFLDQGEPGVTDCGSTMSGIWGRPGAVYDAGTDRVLIATSNGWFDANIGGQDWGDSVLTLSADGGGGAAGLPVDSFSPDNYDQLRNADLDFGAASPTILPAPANSAYPHLGAHMGKDGFLHLLNLDNLSGLGAPGMIGGDLQTLVITKNPPTNPIPQPAVWSDTEDGSTWLYVVSVWDGLTALHLDVDAQGRPALSVRWSRAGGIATPILANDILFWNGNALDPRDGTLLAPVGPACCYWGGPIVVDGLVISTGDTRVFVFGIDAVFANGFD